MHYVDLSPYCYTPTNDNFGLINVGWLQSGFPFDRSVPNDVFVHNLFNFCTHRVAGRRGYHMCDLCMPSKAVSGCPVERDGIKLTLGSAEIRVHGEGGKIYAAPNLIYHYVVAHQYAPPKEFVDAVLAHPVQADQPPPAILRKKGFKQKILSLLKFNWSS